MATDILAIIVKGDAGQAVREFEKVGRTAERELGRAEKRSERFAAAAAKTGVALTVAAGTAAAGILRLAGVASDLAETVSKTRQVFGAASEQIEQFAGNAATGLGQSKQAALDAASTFGTLFRAIGLGPEKTAQWSIQLTKLASDLASFNNTRPEDAVLALAAALRGESEPIRRFGVLLSDAALKQEALRQGLIDTTSGALPPAIRAQAAYALIMQQTVVAQGDFERTAGGLANQQRILRAQVEDLAASLGESMMPAVTSVLAGINRLLGTVNNLDPSVRSAIGSTAVFATGLAGLVGGASLAVSGIAKLRAAFIALQLSSGPAIAALAAGAAVFAVFQADASRAAARVSKIQEEMGRLNVSADKAAKSLIIAKLETKEFSDVAEVIQEKLGRTPADIADMVLGSEAKWRTLSKELKDLLPDVFKAVAPSKDARVALHVFEEELARWRKAAADAGAATGDLADNYTDFKLAAAGFATQQYSVAAATQETASSAEDAADAYAAWRDQVDELRRAQLAAIDAVLASDEAIDGHAAAMERARKEIADLASTSSADMPQAMRDVRDAIRDAARAADESGRQFAELVGIQWTAQDSGRAQIGALRELKAELKDSELIQWVDTLIDRLNRLSQASVVFPESPRPRPSRGVFEARAAGGPVTAGGAYLVGEHGPELFVPQQSGRIVPPSTTVWHAQRTVTVNQTFTGQVDPVRVAAEIAWAVG